MYYVCSTASILIAASLIAKDVSPGAAMMIYNLVRPVAMGHRNCPTK